MRYVALTIALCLGLQSWSQSIPSEISKAKDAVFYGLDFSFLKLIHEDGFIDKNGKPICKSLPFKYYAEWNDLFLIEKDKFNITKCFAIPKYVIDMATVTDRNKAYAFLEDCIIEDEKYSVAQADLEAAVATLGSESARGLGIVVYVESFNKTANKCILNVVFFNIEDHRIIHQMRSEGAPIGIGLRNFWINAINNAMDREADAFVKARKGSK